MLTIHRILEKIAGGESSGVELKTIALTKGKIPGRYRDDLSDEFAAFANHSGGVVIFGVDDKSRQITGMDAAEVQKLIENISEICSDSIKPPITHFFAESVPVPEDAGKRLVYVEIEQSLWIHESKNGYFYRHGSSKRKMSTEQLVRVVQSRSQARIIRFEEQAVPGTDRSTLQKDLYTRFVNRDDAELLHKRNLLTSVDDTTNATVAGILMCCPEPHRHIDNSYIQAVCYSGTTKDANYQMDARDCRGPLDAQIVAAYKFVEQHNRIAATKRVGREDRPQYSVRAVFEALVNAAVHRDYSKHMSKIRLFMFSDRLEIYSPGRLANTLTIENLRHNQATRNELLSRLLSELTMDSDTGGVRSGRRFLELRGEGVGIILDESKSLSGKEPVYKMLNEELQLTIYAATTP